MGEYIGDKYTLKLNKDDNSYDHIIMQIKKEVNEKYEENKKTGWVDFDVGMNINHDVITVWARGYKIFINTELSENLMQKIKNNIDSDANQYYLYQEDHGENKGAIKVLYGFAIKVKEYLQNADYDFKEENLYDKKNIDKFHACMSQPEILKEVIQESENKRIEAEEEKRYIGQKIISLKEYQQGLKPIKNKM